MADSIPSLRRKNKELADKVAKLEAKLSERVVEYVDVVREVSVETVVAHSVPSAAVGVPAPYAVEVVREVNFPVETPIAAPVYYAREIPVDKIVYVDNPVHLEMIAALQARIRELVSRDE